METHVKQSRRVGRKHDEGGDAKGIQGRCLSLNRPADSHDGEHDERTGYGNRKADGEGVAPQYTHDQQLTHPFCTAKKKCRKDEIEKPAHDTHMKTRNSQHMTDSRCGVDLTQPVTQSTFLTQRHSRYHRQGIAVKPPLPILADDGTAKPHGTYAQSLGPIRRKRVPILGLDTQGSRDAMTEQIRGIVKSRALTGGFVDLAVKNNHAARFKRGGRTVLGQVEINIMTSVQAVLEHYF